MVSILAHLLILSGAAASVLLAGGPQQGNLGAFLLIAGGALVACPPQGRVNPWLCGLGGGIVAAAALAFLPHDWFTQASWRQQLVEAGVPLGKHVTPVPRETGFWLAVLTVTVATALLALAHPLRSRVQLLAATVALGLTGAYVAFAFFVQKSGWEFRFDANPRDFGFFLNRNHTATFLSTGSMIALGMLGVAIRSQRWWHTGAAAAVLAGCVSGLFFFGTSRGGVLSLIAGTVLWVAGLGREHRTRPLLISMAAISVAAGVLFLASPGAVRDRLLAAIGLLKERVSAADDGGDESDEKPLDARIVIYRDTLQVIGDFPFTGIGLGAFRPVFAFYNRGAPPDIPIAHPESDWLMFTAETGVPAVLMLGTAVVLLLRQIWHFREHAYWPLRWGLLCAALAAFGHGFVDVPSHRAALGWWVLALAGLGTQTMVTGVNRPQRWLHVIFIVVGFGAIGLGGQLLRSDFSRAAALPPWEALWAEGEIIELREGGRIRDSVKAADKAIRMSPMAPYPHFHLAASLLALPPDAEHSAEVDLVLRRGRLLAPGDPRVPVEQGLFLAAYDAARAIALFREALSLQERIDTTWTSRRPRLVQLYTEILKQTAPYPEVQRGLLAAAEDRPAFVLVWIQRVAPEVVAAEFPRLAGNAAVANALAPRERRYLLEQWYARGDRAALFAFVNDRADWKAIAAPIECRRLAEEGKYEEAVRGAAGLYGVSIEMPPASPADGDVSTTGGEDVLASFRSAWSKGNTITARRVLEEGRKARPVNPEVWRLLAAWSVRDGQWSAAWKSLDEHIRAAALEAPY